MSGKGILGIENRTENWKTALYFSPFFRDGEARLRLAKRLGAPENTKQEDVHIELFWKGMRDHLHRESQQTRDNPEYFEKLTTQYDCLFGDLLEKIRKFDPSENKLRRPNARNYNPEVDKAGLASNLINTEIDVVVDTPQCLFLGEAKDEADLDGNAQYVLVHQLIRQHVMTRILSKIKGSEKDVQHFLVSKSKRLANLRNTQQVKFMKKQGWLPKGNVLSWEEIEKLA